MEKRLGRGLGSLLGQGAEDEQKIRSREGGRTSAGTRAAGSADAGSTPGGESAARAEEAAASSDGDRQGRLELPLDSIRPNPHQPRLAFDRSSISELRDSIRRHGLLQPIVVRAAEDGGYELIAGERRWRAAREAGLQHIPAVVRDDVSEEDLLELALVENVQREDLDPIEKARGYRQMADRLDLTQDQVAEKVGLNRATVANHLRLLELPAKAQEAVSKGLISMGHARALAGAGDEKAVLSLLGRVVREELSVRRTEALVRSLREGGTSRPTGAGEERSKTVVPQAPPWVRELQSRLQDSLGARVQLQNREGYRGQIVIEYHGREDLERLLQQLAPRAEL